MGGSCSDGRWAGHMFVTGVAQRRCEWRSRECDMQCVLGSLGCARKCVSRACVRAGGQGRHKLACSVEAEHAGEEDGEDDKLAEQLLSATVLIMMVMRSLDRMNAVLEEEQASKRTSTMKEEKDAK